MNLRRIREFVFRDDSYEITTEDESSALVSSLTGIVNIEPGDDSLPDWCLSPEHVVGFESAYSSDGTGRSLFLAFRTEAGELHKLFLGTTSNTGAAESWVTRVNAIYPQSHGLTNGGNAAIARIAPPSGTPFLDELDEANKGTLIPGIYGNMIPRSGAYARPKPYEPAWLTDYAWRSLRNVKQVTGRSRDLDLERADPPGLDTSALMYTLDLVRPRVYRTNKSNDLPRAVIGGEFLFEQPQHRPYIKVLPLCEATHLALVFRRGSRFQEGLRKVRSSLNVTEMNGSLVDWLEALLHCQKKNRKIPIVTLEKEVADFYLLQTLFALKGDAQAFSRYTAASVESMADLLHRFQTDEAVAICDVGVANELRMYYSHYYREVREGFVQLYPRYDTPVKVGLGLPIEDPVWCEICAQSLRETIQEGPAAIQASLNESALRVERSLGMRWTLAA